LELYKQFAEKEWINGENGFENIFEFANGHLLKWFNGTTEQKDPKILELFVQKRLEGKILLIVRREEAKSTHHPSTSVNEGRNEEIRRGKRPMEEGEENKDDMKKKARSTFFLINLYQF